MKNGRAGTPAWQRELEFRRCSMGANPTQAKAVVLFFVAFTLIALGLAADVSIVALLLGFALLAGSLALFAKCKSWEHGEE
jgi:hypothetical protein